MTKNKTVRQRGDAELPPGTSFEKVVARIQQMMDPQSVVTHNELLEDRVGNRRQYDVVIRGQFGGRPVLGIMECKDHNRRKGPDAVEAFAKKTDNLGANLRVMVARRGFTKQALNLAKHENIGCLSLLPDQAAQGGFSIGDMWYGVIRRWVNIRLVIHFALPNAPMAGFDANTVKWTGKPVMNWFLRELLTTHRDEAREGEHTLSVTFDQPRQIEIAGSEWPVVGLSCTAERVCTKKRRWVSWSGDALFDWHSGKFTIPSGGTVVGSAIESDLSTWPDYQGQIPDLDQQREHGFLVAILYNVQMWDDSGSVPDLRALQGEHSANDV